MSTSNVLSPVSPSGEGEIQTRLVLPDELTFTVVTASDRQPLGKRYWLTGSGELETETAVPLASGQVAVEHAPSISAFAQRLEGLEADQALLYGIASIPQARLVTQRTLDAVPREQRRGGIWRKREDIPISPGPGNAWFGFEASGPPPMRL